MYKKTWVEGFGNTLQGKDATEFSLALKEIPVDPNGMCTGGAVNHILEQHGLKHLAERLGAEWMEFTSPEELIELARGFSD